jgi:hypothetical protein
MGSQFFRRKDMRSWIFVAALTLSASGASAEGAPPGLASWIGEDMVCRSRHVAEQVAVNLIRSVENPGDKNAMPRAEALKKSNCFKLAELPKKFLVVDRFRKEFEMRSATIGGLKVFWVMGPFASE